MSKTSEDEALRIVEYAKTGRPNAMISIGWDCLDTIVDPNRRIAHAVTHLGRIDMDVYREGPLVWAPPVVEGQPRLEANSFPEMLELLMHVLPLWIEFNAPPHMGLIKQ